MKISALLIISGLIVFPACQSNVQEIPVNNAAEMENREESLIKINNYVAKRNQELIQQFVKRTGLELKETGSGLWYGKYSEGHGSKIKTGCLVEISYQRLLLDGSFIDSVSVKNPKIIKVGSGGVEAGLEEGLLLLNEGDRAQLVLPPHLAHGNFGDQNVIPPGAFLLYDISVLRVKP